MLTVLLLTIGGVIGSLFIPGEKGINNYLISVLGGSILGAFSGILLAFVIGIFLPTRYEKIEEERLAALKNSKTVSSSFFLGCGYINSKLYYAYYRERDDGGYEYDQVSAGTAVIYEYDKKSEMAYPRLEIYEKVFKKEKYYLFGFLEDFNDIRYKFFVPKGTVVRDFSFDLE